MIRAYDDYGNIIDDYEKQIRVKTIDEIILTLSQSEDTILSDRQYYELLKLKQEE